MPKKDKGYRIEKSIFGRFIIVHPRNRNLAWTGLNWTPHLRGVSDGGIQISNFETEGDADEHASENNVSANVFLVRRPEFKPKPGFTQRTHCPDCGGDLMVCGMIVLGEERCRVCHAKKAASKARIEKMHDARWGSRRRANNGDQA